MEYTIVELEEKKLVGIGSHLANNDADSMQKIGKLWDDIFTKNVFENVKNINAPYPICLYSDYADTMVDGKELSYDITLGFAVNTFDGQAPNWVSKTIPAGKYAKFVITGDVSTAVGAAWNEIWQLPLNRSYTGDFEQYLNEDMENAQVEIYVALKA